MKKNTYNYLNIVKNYTHLSDSEPVERFTDCLKKFVDKKKFDKYIDDAKTCFIVAEDYKEAMLLISLCLGGQQTIN